MQGDTYYFEGVERCFVAQGVERRGEGELQGVQREARPQEGGGHPHQHGLLEALREVRAGRVHRHVIILHNKQQNNIVQQL